MKHREHSIPRFKLLHTFVPLQDVISVHWSLSMISFWTLPQQTLYYFIWILNHPIFSTVSPWRQHLLPPFPMPRSSGPAIVPTEVSRTSATRLCHHRCHFWTDYTRCHRPRGGGPLLDIVTRIPSEASIVWTHGQRRTVVSECHL